MQLEIQSLKTVKAIDSVLQTPQNNVYSKSHETRSSSSEVEKDDIHTEPTKKQLKKLTEEASHIMLGVNAQLTFRVHEKSGRQMVQLIERETQEVIREIPPEKMLDVLAGIWEWAGLIVDRKE